MFRPTGITIRLTGEWMGYMRMTPLHQECSWMMNFITDMTRDYASRSSPQTSGFKTSSKFIREYNDKDPYKNGSRMTLREGTTRLVRSSSVNKELQNNFGERTGGVSPPRTSSPPSAVSQRTIPEQSGVGQRYNDMCQGDRVCPD